MDSHKDMDAPKHEDQRGPDTMHKQNEFDPKHAAFERELKHAFVRVNAPDTLQTFLLAAAEAEAERERQGRRVLWFKPAHSRHKVLVFPRAQTWVGGAIAAVLVLGTIGSVEAIHLQNVRRQDEATRQFAQAEQIRDRALEHAREQIERAGAGFEQ